MSKKLLIIFMTNLLFSCSHNAEVYKNNSPKLDYKKLFTGKLKAYAVYFDFFGNQSNRFTIESDGKFDKKNNRIDMNQKITYADGDVESGHAYAIFDDKDENHFLYKDHMMLNEGVYSQYGNAANVKYDLRVKRKNKSDIVVSCDDWLYMVDEKTGINRIKISKFGIKVGEIVMTIVK